MRIGGWQKVSLVDYPGKICTILFTQGCNFRCPYCHNPELVVSALFQRCYPEETIFGFLEKRRGIIDAVSITGGEPTIHPDLAEVIGRIKALGYQVKLDTNGSHPRFLNRLIAQDLLDYIAMDIKGPLDRYGDITGVPVEIEDISKSIQIIMESDVPYEFRTTVIESLHSQNDFEKIGAMIKNASRYVLQSYRPTKTLDPSFLEHTPPSAAFLSTIKASLEGDIQTILIR